MRRELLTAGEAARRPDGRAAQLPGRLLVLRIAMLLCMAMLLAMPSARTAWAEEGGSESGSETTAEEGENPYAAVRKAGRRAILYNPQTGADWKGMTKVKQVPSGSGFFYYFKKATGQVYNKGFFTVKKKTYYAKDNGQLLTGFQKIGNFYYYFSRKGVLKKGALIKVGTQVRYLAGKKGRLKAGVRKVNGNYYYFAKDTRQMQFGWQKVGDNTYFFRTAGKRKGQAATGWLKKSGTKYYFDAKGRMVHGWQTIGNKKYYFDLKTGEMFTGKHTIGGKTYDFGSDGGITVKVTGAWSIRVNQTTCTVTVYRGTTPVKAFACSVGVNGATPTGTFSLLDKLRWHELNGPTWGQWCSHITWNILFHSLPYYSYRNNRTLKPSEYNLIGKPASHGCIRLAAVNAKYIYDNCPIGTKVTIFYGSAKDDPLGKPMPAKVGSWTKTYDPTDPTI